MKILLPLLLIGCATPVAPLRWERPLVAVCVEPGLEDVAELAAAQWSGMDRVPVLAMSNPPVCNVEVGYGETGHLALSRVYPHGGEFRLGTVILSDGIDRHGYDMQSILAHEFGHVLGLEDVEQPGAIMFEQIDIGEVRSVTAADHFELRKIYP